MNSQRLQKLLNYYEQDPNDPFIIYGIALEYEKVNLQKAVEFYDLLLSAHKDYLPTYYQAAHLFWEEQEIEKAEEIFIKGIALAEEQQNQKILHELKNAYQNFQMENL